MTERLRENWLCLSGGNALGAYHAGAYEALAAKGITPTRIAGASIGAITSAIIAGNAPEARVPRLRRFWGKATQHQHVLPLFDGMMPRMGEWLSLLQTLTYGRTSLFRRTLPSLLPLLPGISSPPHVFDPSPLRQTLGKLVDFGRLSSGPVRLLVTAVDLETGDDVTFDSHAGGIELDHLLASTAFPIAFPPVSIDGHVYVDPGVSANLPIVPLLEGSGQQDVLCFALDLMTAHGRVPKSLDDAVGRAQDLIFASQSRHALQSAMRSRTSKESRMVAVVHLSYDGCGQEIGGKFFDFSARSIHRRWAAGKADAEMALALWADLQTPEAGAIYQLHQGGLRPVE